MTVAEVFDQVKALSAQERKELAKLIDMLDIGEPAVQAKTGAEIVAMLQTMEPIEFVDPHIEDPVEWVKHMRAERRRKRLGAWGDAE